MSWEHLEDPPHWVTEVYENDGWKLKFEGDYLTAKGDTWVYKIEFGEAYYRQLKSDYYDTTRNESLHASEVDSFDGRTRACSAHVLTT